MAKHTKTARVLSKVGKELKKSPPAVLAKTVRKKGVKAAKKQRVAILLTKARKRGARIPLPEGAGGVVTNQTPDVSKQGLDLMREVKAI